MHQALAFGSVLLAALGAGSCVAGRRRDTVLVVTMALMVLAMLDTMALGSVLLDPLVWTVVLAGCASGVLALRRRRPPRLEHAAHLGVMALLTGAMALGSSHAGHSTGTVTAAEMPGMSPASPSAMAAATFGVPGGLLILVEVVVACGWGGLLLGRSLTCSGPARVERTAGAASLLVMAAMYARG